MEALVDFPFSVPLHLLQLLLSFVNENKAFDGIIHANRMARRLEKFKEYVAGGA